MGRPALKQPENNKGENLLLSLLQCVSFAECVRLSPANPCACSRALSPSLLLLLLTDWKLVCCLLLLLLSRPQVVSQKGGKRTAFQPSCQELLYKRSRYQIMTYCFSRRHFFLSITLLDWPCELGYTNRARRLVYSGRMDDGVDKFQGKGLSLPLPVYCWWSSWWSIPVFDQFTTVRHRHRRCVLFYPPAGRSRSIWCAGYLPTSWEHGRAGGREWVEIVFFFSFSVCLLRQRGKAKGYIDMHACLVHLILIARVSPESIAIKFTPGGQ